MHITVKVYDAYQHKHGSHVIENLEHLLGHPHYLAGTYVAVSATEELYNRFLGELAIQGVTLRTYRIKVHEERYHLLTGFISISNR